jgi:PAS domain S-box-containing protein
MMEQVSALNVAIVGGGPGCKAIMDVIFAETLSQLRMKLIGVASRNPKAVGHLYAQKKGIYTTTDYRNLYKLKDLHMIIELTGSDQLEDEISRTKPPRVKLMDHVAARVFWDIFNVEEQRIAERRQAEEALRESEQEKDAILNSMSEDVVYHDMEHRIVWANSVASKSVGLTPDDLVGQHCYEMFHRRTKPCPGCPVLKARETGEPQAAEMTSPDGRTWFVRGYPVRHVTNVITGVVEVTLEITKRKRAEEALRRSENLLRMLINATKEAIISIGQDGLITLFNPAAEKMFGLKEEEIIGQPLDLLMPEDVRDRHRQYLESYFVTGKSKKAIGKIVELPGLRSNGKVFPMEISLSAGKHGDEKFVIAVARDITERKEVEEERKTLEAQLQHAQKMESVGTLAGGIAHDFNNLLMAVQGNVSLMLMDIDSTHPTYERLKNVEKQIQSGARLTSHLLGYARKGKYEVKPLDLNQLLKETSDAFGRTRKEVTIHWELSEDLSAIKADPGQIEQVLLNLYVNAADAMPGGGNLILKTMNMTHKDMKDKVYDPKPG